MHAVSKHGYNFSTKTDEIELLNFIFMGLPCALYLHYELVNISKILSPLMGLFHISLLQIKLNILLPSSLFKKFNKN